MKMMEKRLKMAGRRVEAKSSWRGEKESSTQRLYGYRWQKERKVFLRDNPWCKVRGDGCTLMALVVDHIRPHRGDPLIFWDQTNWQGICPHCHNAHKQRSENAQRYGRKTKRS